MKKVLMIAYYFPPAAGSGTIRTLKFAKYLPQYKWKPEVLTVNEDCYESYLPKDFTLLNGILKQSGIHRTPMFRPLNFIFAVRDVLKKRKKNKEMNVLKNNYENRKMKNLKQEIKNGITGFLSTPDEQIGWLPFGVATGLKIIKEKEIDVIYTSASPWTTHLIGYLLKRITRKPWVADFRDPWTQDLLYEERNYTKLRKIIENFLEKQIFKCADKILCISETMKKNFMRSYPFAASKIAVVTNGFDKDEFQFSSAAIGVEKKFIISYIGTLYHKRDPHNFLVALSQIINERKEIRHDIKVQFIGVIKEDKVFRDLIQRLALEDTVEVIGYVSHENALRYLNASTLLLLLIGKQNGSEYILTGKIFEYLASNKPIFALVPEGEAANLIREIGAGVVIDPKDIEKIKHSLLNLYAQYKNGSLKVKLNLNMLDNFDREKLTENLVKIMESCLGK